MQIIPEQTLLLEEAKKRLLAGEIIAYPTETFYGLGVDPRNRQALERLSLLKERELGAGISLILDSAERVEKLIAPEQAELQEVRLSLQERFWPGALTLVIEPSTHARSLFGSEVFARDASLALRVSPEALASELASACAGAITATSANLKGQPPARSAQEVRAYFPDIFLLPSLEPEQVCLEGQQASTILDVRALPFVVLRQGAVVVRSYTEHKK